VKNIESVFKVLRKMTLAGLVAFILASPFVLSPNSAEAQSKNPSFCVKRGSQFDGIVYFRPSAKCPSGEKKLKSLSPTPATVDPVHAGGTLVTAGSNVMFNDVTLLFGNISYDTNTGVITFPESGYYQFTWQVTVDGLANLPTGYDPKTTPPYVFMELSGSAGDLGGATLPTHLGSLTGNVIVEVLSAPFTVSLKNSSPWSVNLAGAHAPKATLSVTRLYTEYGPIVLNLKLD